MNTTYKLPSWVLPDPRAHMKQELAQGVYQCKAFANMDTSPFGILFPHKKTVTEWDLLNKAPLSKPTTRADTFVTQFLEANKPTSAISIDDFESTDGGSAKYFDDDSDYEIMEKPESPVPVPSKETKRETIPVQPAVPPRPPPPPPRVPPPPRPPSPSVETMEAKQPSEPMVLDAAENTHTPPNTKDHGKKEAKHRIHDLVQNFIKEHGATPSQRNPHPTSLKPRRKGAAGMEKLIAHKKKDTSVAKHKEDPTSTLAPVPIQQETASDPFISEKYQKWVAKKIHTPVDTTKPLQSLHHQFVDHLEKEIKQEKIDAAPPVSAAIVDSDSGSDSDSDSKSEKIQKKPVHIDTVTIKKIPKKTVAKAAGTKETKFTGQKKTKTHDTTVVLRKKPQTKPRHVVYQTADSDVGEDAPEPVVHDLTQEDEEEAVPTHTHTARERAVRHFAENPSSPTPADKRKTHVVDLKDQEPDLQREALEDTVAINPDTHRDNTFRFSAETSANLDKLSSYDKIERQMQLESMAKHLPTPQHDDETPQATYKRVLYEINLRTSGGKREPDATTLRLLRYVDSHHPVNERNQIVHALQKKAIALSKLIKKTYASKYDELKHKDDEDEAKWDEDDDI